MNSALKNFLASRTLLLAGAVLVFLLFAKGQARADWTYDNTGPTTTVAVECPAGTAVTNGGVCAAASAVVKIICSDAASGGTGCAEISYRVTNTKDSATTTGKHTYTEPFSDQTYTVTTDPALTVANYAGYTITIDNVSSKDGAGNIGATASSFSFTFDSTPPVTTIAVSCPAAIADGRICSGSSATVTITCTDDGSKCKTITYYVNYKDTGETQTASTDETTVTPTSPFTKILTLGANARGFTVGAHSTDAVGNVESGNTTFSFDFTTCTMDLLVGSPVVMGEFGQASADVTSNSSAVGAITKVDFASADTATATVNPGTDNTGPSYTTTITPVKIGSTTINGTGTTSSNLTCSDSSPLTIMQASAWWQVQDIDVMTNGNIRSIVPSGCSGTCSPYFNLDGLGGFPGVAAYGGASATFNPVLNSDNRLSSKQWLANSGFSTALTRYKYDWFVSQARTATTIDCSSDLNNGNLVSHAAQDKPALVLCDSNATIGGSINLNAKKLLLLVNGNLNINNTVNLEKGKGFFGAIVKGNIVVDPSVTASGSNFAIEGIYMSDGTINTGTGDKKLRIRGSVVGWSGVVFGRNLGDDNDLIPAEFVEYAPDLIMGFPAALMRQQPIWKEVAP